MGVSCHKALWNSRKTSLSADPEVETRAGQLSSRPAVCGLANFAGGIYYSDMMNPLSIIQAHLEELRGLGARRLGIFGSFARGDANDASDVDVYVEFDDKMRTYDNFFALHERLESLLGRSVDLVTDKSLSESKARLILPTVRYASEDS